MQVGKSEIVSCGYMARVDFPKSHDISKAIDKAAGAEREVVGRKSDRRYNYSFPESSRPYQGKTNHDWTKEVSVDSMANITAPATPDAATWDGYGTALKPAWEPIILAMAPLDGTFAHNALTWGVGGLWVDGGRIPTNGETPTGTGNRQSWRDMEGRSDLQPHGLNITPSAGRWPANLILSHSPDCKRVGVRKVGSGSGGPARHNANEGTVAKGKQYEHVTQNYGTETVEAWECVEGCPVAMLDAQSGESTSIVRKPPPKDIGDYEGRQFNDYGAYRPKQYEAGHNDTGGASRFFYCAKASRSERTNGGTIDNTHPTVKPLPLMRYLVKLTRTPTGGVVLDPFMGSCSTGVAAVLEGRDFVGIELGADSYDIARQRIEAAQAEMIQTEMVL